MNELTAVIEAVFAWSLQIWDKCEPSVEVGIALDAAKPTWKTGEDSGSQPKATAIPGQPNALFTELASAP